MFLVAYEIIANSSFQRTNLIFFWASLQYSIIEDRYVCWKLPCLVSRRKRKRGSQHRLTQTTQTWQVTNVLDIQYDCLPRGELEFRNGLTGARSVDYRRQFSLLSWSQDKRETQPLIEVATRRGWYLPRISRQWWKQQYPTRPKTGNTFVWFGLVGGYWLAGEFLHAFLSVEESLMVSDHT